MIVEEMVFQKVWFLVQVDDNNYLNHCNQFREGLQVVISKQKNLNKTVCFKKFTDLPANNLINNNEESNEESSAIVVLTPLGKHPAYRQP